MAELSFGKHVKDDQKPYIERAFDLLDSWSKVVPFENGSDLRVRYFGKSDSNELYNNIIHMNKFFRADFNMLNFRSAAKSEHVGKYGGDTVAFVARTAVPPRRISRVDLNFIDVFVTPNFFTGDHEYWDAYRAGVLYHEMSHLRLCTADIVYGRDECQRLARTKFYSAYRNADNYGFYCEESIARRYNIQKPKLDLDF